MKKLISYFTAALTALTMGVLSFGTVAQAQPLAVAHSAVLQDITSAKQGLNQTVQYYPERRYYRDRSHNNRRYDRPRHWNGPRPGWNHNRPQYRPYYRSTQPRYYRSGRNSHVNWCHNRYRSYRSSDNTFQPNYGPRRQCYSPYI